MYILKDHKDTQRIADHLNYLKGRYPETAARAPAMTREIATCDYFLPWEFQRADIGGVRHGDTELIHEVRSFDLIELCDVCFCSERISPSVAQFLFSREIQIGDLLVQPQIIKLCRTCVGRILNEIPVSIWEKILENLPGVRKALSDLSHQTPDIGML